MLLVFFRLFFFSFFLEVPDGDGPHDGAVFFRRRGRRPLPRLADRRQAGRSSRRHESRRLQREGLRWAKKGTGKRRHHKVAQMTPS